MGRRDADLLFAHSSVDLERNMILRGEPNEIVSSRYYHCIAKLDGTTQPSNIEGSEDSWTDPRWLPQSCSSQVLFWLWHQRVSSQITELG